MQCSIKRLQVDYLDLFFCHRPDPDTSISETVYAMNDLIHQGKILYWGTSEWSAEEIKESFKCAKKFNLEDQQWNNPNIIYYLKTRFEKEYKDIFKKYKIGSTIWSPLASGLLTGKYNDEIPSKSRFKVKGYEWLADTIDKIDFNKIKKINLLAKKLASIISTCYFMVFKK